jgi:hypothetical protein
MLQLLKTFRFWDTQSWHYWMLRHSIDEFYDPDNFWQGEFSHQCSCGFWWFSE